MEITPLPPVDRVIKQYEEPAGDFSSVALIINSVRAEAVIAQRDNQAYTSLIEGIEGMRKEFEPAKNIQIGGLESDVWELIPDEKGMYCLNCKRFTPEEGCLCGWVSLDDIIENVVKPLYGKTTGDK